MIKYYSTILFSLVCLFVYSQNVTTINFTAQDGLPSSQVYDIIQDDYGYLWFSTDKGLSRYNGYDFQNFTTNDGIADNVVFDFLKMPDGKIWCTTNSSELFSISGSTPKFEKYAFNTLLLENTGNLVTKSLYFAPNGDMFMSFHHSLGYLHISSDGKLMSTPIIMSKLDRNNLESLVLKEDNSEPFFFNVTKKVKEKISPYLSYDSHLLKPSSGRKNEALYFTNSEVGVYIDKIGLIIKKGDKVSSATKLNSAAIASGKLNDSLFWIGLYFGGVSVYNLKGERQKSFLNNKSVTQIYIDHENNTWVSTLNNGVYQIKNERIKSMPLEFENALSISSLEVDSANLLYIGYKSGDIFSRSAGNSIRRFYHPSNFIPATIQHDPRINVTYFSSDILFSTKDPMILNAGSSYINIHDDKLLIGMSSTLRLKDKKPLDTLFHLFRVKDLIRYNRRYYACNKKGLFWQEEKEHSPKIHHPISNIRIDDLNVMGKKLVLGTNGQGVLIIDKNHKVLHRIRRIDGLSSNFVSRTYTENDSTLWVCSNIGINRITFEKNQSYRIDKMSANDGLLSDEVWDLLIVKDTIWAGTQLGLNYFAKSDFNALHTSDKNYFSSWTKILVSDQRIDQRKGAFAHDQNKIEFHFQGISFRSPDGLIYRYKLEGLTTNWTQTTNRSVIYSALPAGDYKFIVQIKGENQEWSSNQINYSLTISLPYWKTWWFYFAIVIGISTMIYLFFRYRILSYNRDIVREILRQILKLIRRSPPSIRIKYNGNEVVLETASIQFIRTSANYLEIHTDDKMYLVRSSIDSFLSELPDPLEFLQIHRSYVVRLDKIEQKGKKMLIIQNQEIPVGRKYSEEMDKIQL